MFQKFVLLPFQNQTFFSTFSMFLLEKRKKDILRVETAFSIASDKFEIVRIISIMLYNTLQGGWKV